MSRLLNSFGRVETEVDTSGYALLDTTVPGVYEVEMGPGIYRIVLIGGGGGGGKSRWAVGHDLLYAYARGGVAATADLYMELTQTAIATVTVGRGGTSDYRGDMDSTATDGETSSILGIPNFELICGKGTAGNVYSHVGYPGTMGQVEVSGTTIMRIDMNSNEHPIPSTATSGTRTNLNWPTQATLGRGGGCAAGLSGTVYGGGSGYAYIQYFNKNYFHEWD